MIGKMQFLAVYAALIAAGVYLSLHRDPGVPLKASFNSFPCTISSWRMEAEFTFSSEVKSVLKASDLLSRRYVDERGDQVELYIGYHNGGKESGEVHSPRHCLPGSGWQTESGDNVALAVGGGNLKAVKAIYQKGGSRLLLYYWYQVGRRSVSGEYALKVAEIANSALRGRHDAALIRISVPFKEDEGHATAVADRFLADFLPAINAFLPE
jgi:EpsI family protein